MQDLGHGYWVPKLRVVEARFCGGISWDPPGARALKSRNSSRSDRRRPRPRAQCVFRTCVQTVPSIHLPPLRKSVASVFASEPRHVEAAAYNRSLRLLCTPTNTCLPSPPVRQRVELRDPLFFSCRQFIPLLSGDKNAAEAAGTGHHKRPTRLVALCVPV